ALSSPTQASSVLTYGASGSGGRIGSPVIGSTRCRSRSSESSLRPNEGLAQWAGMGDLTRGGPARRDRDTGSMGINFPQIARKVLVGRSRSVKQSAHTTWRGAAARGKPEGGRHVCLRETSWLAERPP